MPQYTSLHNTKFNSIATILNIPASPKKPHKFRINTLENFIQF